jgi:hypothetical protein
VLTSAAAAIRIRRLGGRVHGNNTLILHWDGGS